MSEEKTTEIQRSVNTVEVLDKIQEQLSGFSREPFRKELARLSGITDKVDDTSQTPYSPHKFQNLPMMKKRQMLAEFESKIKDELKKELEMKGAIVDPDTLEKVSIMELNNGDGKKEWPGYPVQTTHNNGA